MDALVKEFLSESEEGLDRMERCLTKMQRQPGNAALLGETFRALHTIKGGTGFLGYRRLEGLAHAGEGLLDALRKQQLTMTPERLVGLLRLTDALRGVLLLIERTGGEGFRESDDAGDAALVKLLLTLGRCAEVGSDGGGAGEECGEGVRGGGTSAEDRLRGLAEGLEQTAVRIEVQELTRLTELVGELEAAQSFLLDGRATAAEELCLQEGQRLARITKELRETVEGARTQPAEVLFRRLPRIVRDVASACGRRVQLEIVGEETALDKSVLYALRDPLTHALRNAVDHGIEAPAERARLGKPMEGRVRVEARAVGEMVEIEVSDDGAGISRAAVLERAIKLGFVEEQSALATTDAEILWMVFRQGFSTAKEVTHISGRGVGMDVVWANVEGMGGTVEMVSREGTGTRLCLRVPRTLSMVAVLLMRCGGEVMAVPRRSVVEVMLDAAEDRSAEVVMRGYGWISRGWFGGERMDVVRPGEGLGVGPGEGATTDGVVAIVDADGVRYGIACEEILGWREVAVRPTAEVSGGAGVLLGETVVADHGRVLVLDVRGLAAAMRSDDAGSKPSSSMGEGTEEGRCGY